MRCRIVKGTIIFVALITLLLSMLSSFITIGYGASSYKYGYLVSLPEVYIKHVSGDTYKVWGSGYSESQGVSIKKGGSSSKFSVKTFYNGEVKVTAGTWKDAPFKYTGKNLSGEDASTLSEDIWFHSSGGRAYAYEGEDFWDVVNSKGSGNLVLLSIGSIGGSPSSGSYGIQINPDRAEWALIESETADGGTYKIAVASAFQYKSVNKLDDPWSDSDSGGGDPTPKPTQEPEEPDVEEPEYRDEYDTVYLENSVTNKASLSTSDAVIGYKDLTGNLTASGSITSTIIQNPDSGKTVLTGYKQSGNVITRLWTVYESDGATIESNKFSPFSVFGENYNEDGTRNEFYSLQKNFSITPESFRSATSNGWLQKINNIQYFYELRATGITTLTNGRYASYETNDFGSVLLNNINPKASFSLQTLPGDFNNNQPVLDGYYYTNTPTKMSFTFTDSEDDIRDVYIALGKKETIENNMCDLSFRMAHDDTEPEIFVRDDIFKITRVENSNIYGYTVQVEFLQPGQYEYIAYVNDAYSNQSLTTYDQINGTFLVRNGDGPQPPEAIITNPAYAFENETLNLTQNSTDPNGVDDIVWSDWVDNVEDVTTIQDPSAASQEGYEDITGIKTVDKAVSGNSWYNRGGSVTFPTGSAHHYFKVQLNVKDATNLTDTAEQIIKVISNVPVASLEPEDGMNADELKENRSIIISAENSLAPSSDPIQWDKTEWTFGKVENDVVIPLSPSELTKIIDGGYVASGVKPKQYKLQFYKPGVYEVGIKLYNNFSIANPNHEDTVASSTTIRITVVPDEVPISSVGVTSGKPNFIDNPINFTVSFRVSSHSNDGDKITPVKSYNWVLYDDKNNDGEYTEDERVPDNKLRYNIDKTEVYYDVTFAQGMHNKVKAVVTTTEDFGEPYVEELLYRAHGKESRAWERSVTVSTITVVNWIPDAHIDPPPSDESLSKTPYLPTDIDGDTVDDGYFIRAYTDDFIELGTIIKDEIPETCKVNWELSKKNHLGTYDLTTSNGVNWIQSSNVTNTLGLMGGTLRINSNGIYKLRMIVTDDTGDTSEDTIMIRIYPLPIGVLESNPDFLIYGDAWKTKENIRFDFRANPTIVNDEWGVAWHSMNWSMDDWDIIPLDGQSKDDIHFTTVDWKSQTNVANMNYPDQTPDDLTKFSGRDSQIGFGGTTNTLIDIIAITGLYGEKDKDNNLEITTAAAERFYSAAQQLANDISDKDPRYNVRFFKGSAAITTLDEFVTEIPYGFFDGFKNTQDDEYNKYTESYSITWNNEGVPNDETGRGTSGSAVLMPNITKMNETTGTSDGFETAEAGYLTVLNGYDPDHETDVQGSQQTKDMPFYGSIIVTAYNPNTWEDQLLYKVDYGEFGTNLDNDLNNTKIAILDRNRDTNGNLTNEWTITGTVDNNGDGEYDYEPIVVSPDDPLTLTIHFKGYSGKEETIAPEDQETDPWYIWNDIEGIGSDIPDSEKKVCGSYLAVGMRGWAGIYKTETKNVTHPLSILDTLKTIKYRPNATTIVLFATNNIVDTPEIQDLIDLLDSEKSLGTTNHWVETNDYTELIDYIKANNLKFVTMTVGDTVSKTELGNVTSYPVIKELHNDLGQAYNPIHGGGVTTMGYTLSSNNYMGEAESIIGLNLSSYILSITELVDNTEYRSCTFTAPGNYQVVYWGTNYGNKTSLPVYYTINVMPDEKPIISADVADKFYRDPNDNNNVSIEVGGPFNSFYGDVPTITSPDGDYIDRTIITFRYDKENDGSFSNNLPVVLAETKGSNLSSSVLNSIGLTRFYYELYKLGN